MPDAKLTKCKQRKKKERKDLRKKKNSHKDLGNATQGIFLIKLFNTRVASPKFYLKQSSHAKTITCRKMRGEIKTKEGKNHTKQCHHKYEICLMEMI